MTAVGWLWPAEKNVGGIHRTVRYLMAPPLVAIGIATLAGWLPVASGLAGLVVGAGAVLAGLVSFVEAHTQKCPGYAAMGIDTCERPPSYDGGGTENAT